MKLSRQTYWWLLISLFFGIAGWLVNKHSRSGSMLRQYAQQLSQYYVEQENKIDPLLQDTLHWQFIFEKAQRTYALPTLEDITFLQQWADQEVVWILFQEQQPIFWTDNTLIVPGEILEQVRKDKQLGAVRLNTGYYILKSKNWTTKVGSVQLIAAIPIKREYSVKGPYLNTEFEPSLSALPKDLMVDQQGEEAVLGSDGTPLFYLSNTANTLDQKWYLLSLLLYLLGFIFFVLCINKVANNLAHKVHPGLGAGFIILALLVLSIVINGLGITDSLADLPFLDQSANISIINQSLGEFFLSSLILLWLMVFFHREFRLKLQPKLLAPWPAIFTTVTYWLSIVSLLLIIRLFQNLAVESNLVFDFEYIFSLEFQTLLAILGGLIVIIAIFLFNHRLLQTTSRLGNSLTARLIAAMAALILASPIFFVLQLQIAPPVVLMMAVVFVFGLDFTLDRPVVSLTSAVCWLLFFAICTSIALYSFQQDQHSKTSMHYAQILSKPQDEVLEQAVARLKERLDKEFSLNNFLSNLDTIPIAGNLIYPTISDYFSAEPYLFQHYTFDLFGIEKNGNKMLIEGQRLVESMRLLENQLNAKVSTVAGLYFWETPNPQNLAYLLDLSPSDTSRYFFMALKHKSQKDQRVYGDLIQKIPYKGLSQLPAYNYATYGGLRLLKQEGKIPNSLQIPINALEAEQFRTINTGELSTLIYQNKQDFTVLLSRQKGGLLQALSLFSFLFSLLVLLVIILSVFNYYSQAVPHTFEFSSLHRASLRNRIQRAIILLILGSFILVGFVTAAFFRRNALRAGSEQLNEKAQAVLSDLQRNFGAVETTVDGLGFLEPLIGPIADIHNMDINIYDLKGKLQLTSAEYLFSQQVMGPLMDPLALQALRLPTRSAYRSEERIGDLIYQSANVPIRDDNEEIIAYLELPYYANDRELRNDLQSFLSALLNVYVFLLLVAGAIALFVAESITQPISKIGEKLSQFRLGYNEPLEWKSPDEIGQLIAEYNLMIEKLEESAEKLKQSEREGAWREMAKQVAHEIKNPLTPMKLNIQHLLRVQQQDPERANEMLEDVAQSIIQQIDGLSRIAGEFSNFAKMPQAQNEIFVLNKLVSSVYNLYAKGDHGSTQLSLHLPDEQLELFADPTQLMRVINNLVKNALQAIPDKRKGQVDIRLTHERDKAILSVRDNGSGIPLALQEKVFFPNFTTKNSGMGLGLAMSRSIVNAAKGRIYFETIEAVGTTFYVELPIPKNKED